MNPTQTDAPEILEQEAHLASMQTDVLSEFVCKCPNASLTISVLIRFEKEWI